jgi:methylase of polypeptide subunit release factors
MMPDPEMSLAVVSQFGDVLRQAGYNEAGLRQAVGTSTSLSHDPRASDVARRRLSPGIAVHSLIKLFLLGLPAGRDKLAAAIRPSKLDELAKLGIIAEDGGLIHPRIAIDAAEGLLIAHDPALPGRVLAGDHVIGLGPAPRTLAALTVRSRVGRVLDLGTGSGVQALLASNHADDVVATDINPRALAYTRFNAALNHVATPTIREGDLFEPVANELFDLIVANPPYVLSPDSSLHFRDSGMAGDQLSHTVVREAGRHLKDGGFASILVTWAHHEGATWEEPLAGWVEGLGCDALLLRFRSYDPVTYASLWIKDEVDFASALDRWLSYYRRLGIGAMSSGAVILRRRSGLNWMRCADVLKAPVRVAGDHLLRIFHANDCLSRMPDTEFLGQKFRPHPGHCIHRTGVSSEGRYLIQSQYLETTTGIPLRISLGAFGSRLLMELDGGRSLRAVTSQLGATSGMPPADAVRKAIQTVKQLVALGFLEIDGPGSEPECSLSSSMLAPLEGAR